MPKCMNPTFGPATAKFRPARWSCGLLPQLILPSFVCGFVVLLTLSATSFAAPAVRERFSFRCSAGASAPAGHSMRRLKPARYTDVEIALIEVTTASDLTRFAVDRWTDGPGDNRSAPRPTGLVRRTLPSARHTDRPSGRS